MTRQDFDELRKIIETVVDEKISHLPTKDEFYQAMDKQAGLIMESQEDRAMVNFRVSDHEKRIVKLEKTVSAS